MIPESDCEVSDYNVFDIDDDDDYTTSPDVYSEIEDRVSETIRKNQTTTMHIVHSGHRIVVGKQEERRPRETQKEEEEDE